MPWGKTTDWTIDRMVVEALEVGQEAVYGLIKCPAPIYRQGLQREAVPGEHVLIGHTSDIRQTILAVIENPSPCVRAWKPNVVRIEVQTAISLVTGGLRASQLAAEFKPACDGDASAGPAN